MNKLQRTVDGQKLLFTTLPRIFQSLASDLPSGVIRLSNGQQAYWRLGRNLTDLKKSSTSVRECASRLAKAFKTMTESETFMNHYGITRPPMIANEANLTKMFVSMLQMNTNRVDQSSVSHGGNKPLVESIWFSLGQQVQFIARRGDTAHPHGEGLRGKIWLTAADHAANKEPYLFTIVSPVVHLTEWISEERLVREVVSRLKTNLPSMVKNPVMKFGEGLFASYITSGLAALMEKHPPIPNGEQKKKSALVKPSATAEEFNRFVEKDMIDRVKAGQYTPIVGESIPDAETAAQTAEAITDAKKAAEVDKLISEMGEDGSSVLVVDPSEGPEEGPEETFGGDSTTATNLAEKINAVAPAARGRGMNRATFALDDSPIKVNAAPVNFELGIKDSAVAGIGAEVTAETNFDQPASDVFVAEAISAPVSVDFAAVVVDNNEGLRSAVIDGSLDEFKGAPTTSLVEALNKEPIPEDPLRLKNAEGMWESMFHEQFDPSKFVEGSYANLVGDDGLPRKVVNKEGSWIIEEPEAAPDNSYKLAP